MDPKTKYRIKAGKGTPLLPEGMIVTTPSEGDWDKARGHKNRDAIQCSVPNGGALYVTADMVEPA